MAGLFNVPSRNHLIRSKKLLIVDDFRLLLMGEMIFYSLRLICLEAAGFALRMGDDRSTMQIASALDGDLKRNTFLNSTPLQPAAVSVNCRVLSTLYLLTSWKPILDSLCRTHFDFEALAFSGASLVVSRLTGSHWLPLVTYQSLTGAVRDIILNFECSSRRPYEIQFFMNVH